MKKTKPIAVTGYPICSYCHPEQDPVFDEKEYNESATGIIFCSKCGRVVFRYSDWDWK